MKYYFTFLLCWICLIQCTSDKKIIGTWIDPNNLVDADIIRFYDDYFVYVSPWKNKEYDEHKCYYSIRKDSIYMSLPYEYKEVFKYVKNKDSLVFINSAKNSHFCFERYQDNNIMEFFNRKYGQHINLPKIKLEPYGKQYSNPNVFFIDYKNGSAKLFYNNEEQSIDTSLHLNLSLPSDRDLWWEINNICFFDMSTPYNIVRQIKRELAKVSLFSIKYISIDDKNNLYEMTYRIPSLENSTTSKKENRFSFEVYENKLLYNGSNISEVQLMEKLANNMKSFSESICEFYVDDNVSYGYYICLLNAIKQVYYTIRNEYAAKKYGIADYRSVELDENVEADILKQTPMKIIELWHKR